MSLGFPADKLTISYSGILVNQKLFLLIPLFAPHFFYLTKEYFMILLCCKSLRVNGLGPRRGGFSALSPW